MNTEKKRMLAHSFLCAGVVFVIIAMPRVGLASEQEVGEATEFMVGPAEFAQTEYGEPQSGQEPDYELYYEDYDPNYDDDDYEGDEDLEDDDL